ncbi:MAG TPA: site-2 protease family protein [Mycobacteriales bacterium]|nr:site-2 protease family protein [Mycobacteriales bacterium]
MSQEQPRRQPPGWLVNGLSAGRIFGIPIYFAPSWFLVAAFITWQFGPIVNDRVGGLGAWQYAVALVFALLLYGSVLIHEISHSVVAKALGLPVRRIVLQLLGGVSEITREPQTAGREYLVAVAGPLTSIFLAGVGAAVVPALEKNTVGWAIAYEFAFANAIVAVFNLLPGLPLDGGRVLRAALWRLSGDKVRGTRAAANFGRGLAVVMALAPVAAGQISGGQQAAGSLIYLWLLALFIWTGATQSLVHTQVTATLPLLRVRELLRPATQVAPDLPLAEALRRAREAGARALITVDRDGAPEGVVSEAAVLAVPVERRPWVPVASVTHTLDAGMRLPLDLEGEALVDAIKQAPAGEYVVVGDRGEVAGVLVQADLATALRSGVAAR